jgi:hypothetical protein
MRRGDNLISPFSSLRLLIEIAEEIVAPYEWVKHDKQFRQRLVPAAVLNKSGRVRVASGP